MDTLELLGHVMALRHALRSVYGDVVEYAILHNLRARDILTTNSLDMLHDTLVGSYQFLIHRGNQDREKKED